MMNCFGHNKKSMTDEEKKKELSFRIEQVLYFADREGFNIIELAIGEEALRLINHPYFLGPNGVTKLTQ